MKRKILCLLILSLPVLSTGFVTWASRNFSTALPTSASSKNWIYVPDNYTTISEALSRYDPGREQGIFVRSGSYPENLNITAKERIRSPLILQGQDAETTVINGTGTVVLIDIMNVTIAGFKMQNVAEKNDTCGLFIANTTYCNVAGNIITNNFEGIYLYNSGNCTISGNHIADSGGKGIRLVLSDDNMISGNELTENDIGIAIIGSRENVVNGNHVAGNDIGIYVNSSDKNMVFENNITGSSTGFKVFQSVNNTIFHNNFLDNTQHVYDEAWDHPESVFIVNSTNFWNDQYPSGGNYWSNATKIDTHWGTNQTASGSDMIADTPHVLYKKNEDGFPLVKPWPMPGFQLFDIGNYSIDSVVYMNHLLVLTDASIMNVSFDPTSLKQLSLSLATNSSDCCPMIIPKQVLDGVLNFLVDGVPLACCIEYTDNENMINFTHGRGDFKVKIVGEYAERSPISQFPDIDGDGEISIIDIAIVAKHFRQERLIGSP